MGNRWQHLRKLAFLVAVMTLSSFSLDRVSGSPAKQGSPVLLVYGQTVDGDLDRTTPSTFYEFDAALADVVTISMIVTEGALDPFLVLNDPDGLPLVTDDNSGGGLNARLTFVIPADGRYSIQATHAGGLTPEEGGAFSLNLTAVVDGEPVEDTDGSATPTTDVNTEQESADEPDEMPDVDVEVGLPQQGDAVRLAALEAGGMIRDMLDARVAVRYYWFETRAGDQIAVNPEQIADFQPSLTLYDSAFEEIQRAGPGTSMRSVMRSDGIYFLAVSLPETESRGGEFGFSFSVTGNPARSGEFLEIAYGETQRGSIDETTPSVTYRFRGRADTNIDISMQRTGGDLNCYLYLLDETGQLLFEDNDSGGNGDAQIAYTLPSDGEYLVVATRLGQAQGTTSGSYVLTLTADADPVDVPLDIETDDPPAMPEALANLPELVYGQTVEGVISETRVLNAYVFWGQADDSISIEMTSLNADEFNGLDPLVILLNRDRIPLAENDDIVEGIERDARLEFTLPESDYYVIVATRFEQDEGESVGPFRLTLTGPDPVESEDAVTVATGNTTPLNKLDTQTIAAGSSVQSTFEQGAALYVFSGASGALVDISVTVDAGLETILILADAELNEVLSSSTGALTGITLPQSGRYLVMVAPRYGPLATIGSGYILAVTSTGVTDDTAVDGNSDIQGPQTIVYGDVVNGVIDDARVSQIYVFSGSEGERIRIGMEAAEGSALDTYLELQDANGITVDANDDIDPGVIRDSEIVTTLPTDGDYTIIASRYVGDDAPLTEGSYRLSLELVDETFEQAVAGVEQTVIPLVYGQTETGEITDERYLVFYVFEGSLGDVITIDVNNLSGNLDSVLHLYQSVGDGWLEIANNDDSEIGGTYEAMLQNIVLPQTGTYLIVVGRYGLDRESTFGTFTITLSLEQ